MGVIEALRRSKFKFSGRQKIFVSKNHGFTKWTREEYVNMKADGRLQNDGVNVKYFPEHGPLSRWCKPGCPGRSRLLDEVIRFCQHLKPRPISAHENKQLH